MTGVLIAVTFLTFPDRLNGFWSPKAAVWLVGSLALASSVWWNPPKAKGLSNPFIGFLFIWIVLLFSWKLLVPQLVVPGTTDAVVQIPWHFSVIIPSVIGLGSFLAMDAIIRHADHPSRWIALAESICWIAGAIALYGALQIVHLDPFRLGERVIAGFVRRNDPITTFGNYSLTANFLAICSPLCLVFRQRRFLLLYLLMSAVILYTKSAASILAWGIGSVLACWWLRRIRLLFWLFLGATLGFLVAFHQGWLSGFLNPSGRLEAWQRAWELWRSGFPLSAWIGTGLGSVEHLATQRFWDWGSLHNEPFQVLFELGGVGFGLMLLAVGWTLIKVFFAQKPSILRVWGASAVSFAIISCFSFPLRLAPMLAVGVCIWSALESLSEGGRYARV